MKYYITTPIYYINDKPHIGHAYTTIAADVLARYHRAKGDEVFFLTGTDEHGAKIAEAAEKAGKEPQQFADDLVPKFADAWNNLNISYDEFFRTTNPQHEKIVQEFVGELKARGYVEKRKYEGLYCVGCEKFLKESELVDGKCPDHKKEPVKQAEENYFFKLSEFSDQILEKIKKGEIEIGPVQRKNEIIGKIRQGLEDISISRAGVKWGIPFPEDPEQTIYVWVDALLNYYSATRIYWRDRGAEGQRDEKPIRQAQGRQGTGNEERVWPADLHLMAKDILWFHAVIWPAMLIAADEKLPKKVFAHGFFTINNQKMSKTVGNVIDPNEIVAKYGADAVRYALLREFPFGEDGDISVEKIEAHYNTLANNIGNLLQRTISMINKYNVVIVSETKNLASENEHAASPRSFTNVQDDSRINIDEEIDQLDFMGALKKIDELAIEANKNIAEKQPWNLAKENKTEELTEVLSQVFNSLGLVTNLITPFMPETAEKMKSQLESLKPEPLFPRLDS